MKKIIIALLFPLLLSCTVLDTKNLEELKEAKTREYISKKDDVYKAIFDTFIDKNITLIDFDEKNGKVEGRSIKPVDRLFGSYIDVTEYDIYVTEINEKVKINSNLKKLKLYPKEGAKEIDDLEDVNVYLDLMNNIDKNINSDVYSDEHNERTITVKTNDIEKIMDAIKVVALDEGFDIEKIDTKIGVIKFYKSRDIRRFLAKAKEIDSYKVLLTNKNGVTRVNLDIKIYQSNKVGIDNINEVNSDVYKNMMNKIEEKINQILNNK